MDKNIKNKMDLKLVTSLFRLQNMFRYIHFLVIYHLKNL